MNSTQLKLAGKAVLCCIHHVEKNQYSQLMYDRALEKPAECMCCGNVFAYPFNTQDTPLFCPNCSPERGV